MVGARCMIPLSKLQDDLRDKTKEFESIAEDKLKNLFVARETANESFIETLKGDEETIYDSKTYHLNKVIVKRGRFGDVIGTDIEWQ